MVVCLVGVLMLATSITQAQCTTCTTCLRSDELAVRHGWAIRATAADPSTGYGSVGYTYQSWASTNVTLGQYCGEYSFSRVCENGHLTVLLSGMPRLFRRWHHPGDSP